MPENKNNFKEKLTDLSTQPNTDFLSELRTKLPQFFTAEKLDEDGNIVKAAEFDIEKFKANLAQNNINEIHDGYTLNYVGKTYARLQVGQPTPTVIIPDLKHNAEPENAKSKNVFLTGDNLDVLKHLRNAYTGSVDFIYIDPPYNTGSDGFVYNDKFDLKDEDLRDTLGFSDEDINRLHLLNGRSSHSAWLTFMYPRLKIAQQLLKDTGVIFVSIDDNEQADLKLLMDDVFGEGNFVEQLIWKGKGGGQDSTHFVPVYESIFVYSRKLSNFELGINLIDEDESAYNFFDEKRQLKYKRQLARKWGSNARREDRPNLYFGIVAPDGTEIFPHLPDGTDGRWRHNKSRLQLEINNGDFEFVKGENSGEWILYQKMFVSEDGKKAKKFSNLIDDISSGSGSKYLKKLFDDNTLFDYPKPVELIKRFLSMIHDDELLILDFFAGSATTADAVMQLNAEDGGGHRQYILATLDEEAKSEVAKSAGYTTIDEISRERIKRAAKKVKEENPITTADQDFGFKHFYVKDIDAQTVDKIVDFDPNNLQLIADDMVAEFGKPFKTLAGNEITTGASGEDTILQTWLTDDGYKFNQEVKKIQLDQHFAYHIENLLYIISPIDQDDIKALLNLIGEHKLNVATIIVFGYSLDFATMTSLKNNVKTALDSVKVEVRY